jgi:hypothetical protein
MSNQKYPIQKSSYSGKIVNGREVVLVSEVYEFVQQTFLVERMIRFLKSLGYKIYHPDSNRLAIDPKF